MNQIKILSGPTKFDLMMALMEPSIGPARRHVVLILEGDRNGRSEIKAAINGIELESGCGKRFLLKGYALGIEKKFSAYYDTTTQTGGITFRNI